jgi:starvation-inducible DNA-binding protein
MPIDIGIPDKDRTAIAEGLSRVLADNYTLYLKTHNYHWNVTGPSFPQLHIMFEDQYRELWAATDTIAERMRALGAKAPGTYAQLSRLTSIHEDNDLPNANQMVANLVRGNEQLTKVAREVFNIADRAGDEATGDLMIERMTAAEKAAWMLRSIIE